MQKPVLIFDLAETLIGGLFWMVEPAAKQLKVTEDAIREYFGGHHLVSFFQGDLTEVQYWNTVLNLSGFNSSPKILGDLARESFKKTVPGMVSLLSRLSKYKRVLLSDHAREWIDYIDQKHDFLQKLDQRFLSFEMKSTKHDHKTFDHVAQELGVRPENCLFIDDLTSNIEKAAQQGFRTIHFLNAAQLEKDLLHQGIIFDD
ncbi:MAG: hypothetical protein DWQ05_13730 [Calditrichaeota bacterium]|nr:MAG: hypothetical protein DWQ05_13730 [Calditrichota bacterium]